MKTHKRILKEAQVVLKALAHARDDDGNRLNVCNLEMYITDADTDQVLELEIGVDENGDLEKVQSLTEKVDVNYSDYT